MGLVHEKLTFLEVSLVEREIQLFRRGMRGLQRWEEKLAQGLGKVVLSGAPL